jgi:aldehyde dehydrogenase (NAD+)
VITGGGRPADEALRYGCYVEPTLVRVQPGHALWRDEVFGPQVAVNLPTPGRDLHRPFGGFRESGSPCKEQGAPGLRFYTRLKTAAVRYSW